MSESAAPDNSAMLLSFHLGERDVFIISADGSSSEPQVDRVAGQAPAIAAAVERIHSLFSRINYKRPERTTDMAWLAPLGRALLAPVADRLRKSTHIVVAPHAALHSLPLHLLPQPEGHPLGITHSVCYAPNLSLYAALLERAGNAAPAFTTPSLCLAAADANDSAPVSDAFVIAPRDFARRTGGLFRHGLSASRDEFVTHARSAAVLYLSCHGQFEPDDSLMSSLLLSDGETLPSRRDGNSRNHSITVRDILDLNLRTKLVVLDACVSGKQHHGVGDEPMGFPTAFLLAGAGAVIASNWNVEQNFSRDFMLCLIGKWLGGGPIGDAMKHAVTSVRQKYPHPFHWGAFSLVGNDRLLFS